MTQGDPGDDHILALPDGRRLSWSDVGAAGGSAVLTLHGTPGSRLGRHRDQMHLRDLGIRHLTYDRPGYGRSDPQPGRSVADAAADVRALLDAAGVERTAVIGGSGGGPHALALATLLPERCTVVHCLVGVAPYDAPGLDFFAGMDRENQRRFHLAAGTRAEVIDRFTTEVERLSAARTEDPASLMGDMKLPESDRAILRQNAEQAMAMLAEAFVQGVVGMADDFIALSRPWGFDPSAARAPVLISYGERDVNVPAGHGRWLAAHVPNIGVRILSESGHLMSTEQQLALLVEAAAHGNLGVSTEPDGRGFRP